MVLIPLIFLYLLLLIIILMCVPIFPHSDWGIDFNGNYMKDIRSINPASKPGILLFLKSGTPLSNNYLLSWNITGLFSCLLPAPISFQQPKYQYA